MKRSQIIIALTLVLCCGSAFSASSKPSYTLQVEWPVSTSYFGEKYKKSDLPNFKGDNFIIKDFFESSESYGCSPQYCEKQTPFSASKIFESDCEYLKKYFYRFGQNNHNTTQELWNRSGNCYSKGQSQYFADMVKTHKKFNFVQALKAKGIVPSKTKLYTNDEFASALAPLFGGKRPQMLCGQNIYSNLQTEVKAPIFRYFNVFLDDKFNPSEQMNRLCTYEYCQTFYYLPLEF